MIMQETLKLIREVILNTAKKYGIEIDRIILFGSRARGDYRENSDWDILIVTKKKLDWKKRNEFYADISWELVNKNIAPEIIIVDKETFEKHKHLAGFVYYWAEKEGVLVV